LLKAYSHSIFHFYIRGTIPENCIEINFTYSLVTEPIIKYLKCFPPDDFKGSTWKKQSKDEKQFVVYCPGIQPGRTYNFVFNTIRTINGEDADTLKKHLFTTYIQILNENPTLDSLKVIEINKEINNTIKKRFSFNR